MRVEGCPFRVRLQCLRNAYVVVAGNESIILKSDKFKNALRAVIGSALNTL